MMKRFFLLCMLASVASVWAASDNMREIVIQWPVQRGSERTYRRELKKAFVIGDTAWFEYQTDKWAPAYLGEKDTLVRWIPGTPEAPLFLDYGWHRAWGVSWSWDDEPRLMQAIGSLPATDELNGVAVTQSYFKNNNDIQNFAVQKIQRVARGRASVVRGFRERIKELAEQKQVSTVQIDGEDVELSGIQTEPGLDVERLIEVGRILQELPDSVAQPLANSPSAHQHLTNFPNQTLSQSPSRSKKHDYRWVAPGGALLAAGGGIGIWHLVKHLQQATRARKRMRGLRSLKYSPEIRRAYLENNLAYNHAMQRALLYGVLGGAGALAGGAAVWHGWNKDKK